jgi:hypothetical protein
LPQKRKASMARPPVRVRRHKPRILSVSVDKARLQKYQDAAARGFRGNISDFLRAAADALVVQLAENEKEFDQVRSDFWRSVAELLNDIPPRAPKR